MIPFRVALRPGEPIYEQVLFAAKRAILSRQLRPGDMFPSVRELSKTLKINPNTAHKVVSNLTSAGLLEVLPGIGTVVARAAAAPSKADRARLLGRDVERVVVEARRLGLDLEDVEAALREQWRRMDGHKED